MSSLAGAPTEQRREFALRALRHEPAVAPRTTRFYSNGGYSIAAAMAERVTGEAWESLMRSRLFEPLGMHATFDWPAFGDSKQTWGHIETPDGVLPHDPHDEYQLPAFLLPAGAVSITPTDYAKFLQLHLKGLAGLDGLLKSQTTGNWTERPLTGCPMGDRGGNRDSSLFAIPRRCPMVARRASDFGLLPIRSPGSMAHATCSVCRR